MEGLKFIRNVLDSYNIKNEINLLPDGTEIVNFTINGKSSTYNICVKQLDTNEYYIYTTLMQVSKNARHSICKALNEYNKKYSIVKLFYNEEEQAALLYASCCVPPLTTFGTVDFFDKILAAFIPALDGIMSEIPVLEFQGKEKKVVFTDGRPVVKIDKISTTPMDVITNSNNTLEERPVKEDDNQKHEQCVVQSAGICSPMLRNIHKGYGRAAQPIYDECCRVFNWDSSKRHLFGRQQLLYSANATPEGDSVWFLVHSNWTATKGGKWYNKIEGDTIEEMWLSEKGGLQDTTIRVTFAKMKTGEYAFIGIFAPVKLEEKIIASDIVTSNQGVVAKAGESVWIKTYRLISDQYPK